jgi:hypothetical protein
MDFEDENGRDLVAEMIMQGHMLMIARELARLRQKKVVTKVENEFLSALDGICQIHLSSFGTRQFVDLKGSMTHEYSSSHREEEDQLPAEAGSCNPVEALTEGPSEHAAPVSEVHVDSQTTTSGLAPSYAEQHAEVTGSSSARQQTIVDGLATALQQRLQENRLFLDPSGGDSAEPAVSDRVSELRNGRASELASVASQRRVSALQSSIRAQLEASVGMALTGEAAAPRAREERRAEMEPANSVEQLQSLTVVTDMLEGQFRQRLESMLAQQISRGRSTGRLQRQPSQPVPATITNSVGRTDFKQLSDRLEKMERMMSQLVSMQIDVQRSIRQEVSGLLAANGQSLPSSKASRHGACAVCCDEQIDCVLYRCGHMCVCTVCAAQLAKCPVCRAPIRDVVRVFSCDDTFNTETHGVSDTRPADDAYFEAILP